MQFGQAGRLIATNIESIDRLAAERQAQDIGYRSTTSWDIHWYNRETGCIHYSHPFVTVPRLTAAFPDPVVWLSWSLTTVRLMHTAQRHAEAAD